MTTAEAEGLLEDLTRRGVVLTAEADKLRYRAPKGTLTPALRGLIEQHRAALLQVLGPAGAASTGPADGPAIGLPQPATVGAPAEPDQVAALEAELEALLDELGRARGSWPELARDGHPAHEAYRRFCDLERQWLALVARAGHQVAQDEADQVTRRAQRDPQRARLDLLLQWPKEGGLTPAEVAEVRALAQACGVTVRLERLDLQSPAPALVAGRQAACYVLGRRDAILDALEAAQRDGRCIYCGDALTGGVTCGAVECVRQWLHLGAESEGDR